ncbi:NADH:ubiquinone oxidoreductase subunit 4 (chain M) [Halanaeroarchaeum sp. HSR-CO]|uniref:Na(+)/H(+) antiporter subunit D n=1 Tax=Halanaeroarchaeum sp. HSR-CO TaxID=2866382 RepID=UPI00217D25B4|nr:Na(+)/H(+) antiporter subunit D [Halanaeroarchaeum sp. HSR-CO]UWG47492.1 NADH:ubiquinone oxidoreductase subunit 4 (chain M) [Halanaeroarchaeum sp. HSR-CO]
MTESLTLVPPAFVVLLAALLLPFASRRVGHGLGLLATAGVSVWSYLVPAGTHLPVRFLGFEAVLFNVDEFSRLMGIIFGLIGAAAVLYSYSSAAENLQTAFALGYVGTSLGAVFAGDWLSMIFFWELMAVTSTLLVWHHGGPAVRAGFRYAIFHGIGGSLFMVAIVWHYVEVGSFLFSATDGLVAGIPATLAALGIGVNVGFVGLHTWLPDTYPRPHVAASVFLSVYTTKTGVYGLYRVFPDGSIAIAYMGAAMAVVGVTYALLQNDMRRLLSYHIQSQVGYMVAGVGIGTALATAGAFAHVYNHILYKALLFMTAGVVISRTGEENLKYLGGLRTGLPITAIAFTAAALAISGFPGFNGFVSKGMITAAAHYEHLTGIYYLLLAAGVGTFMSFIKFGYYAFYRNTDREFSVSTANPGQAIAMLGVAALLVVYGLVPDLLFSILPGSTADAHPFTTSHLLEGFALAGLGLVGFVVLKKPLSKVGAVPDVDAILNPLVFYGTRTVVRGLTETYAAVDRVVASGSYALAGTIVNPYPFLERVARSLDEEDVSVLPGSLQATIGTSILLMVVILGGVLVGVLN